MLERNETFESDVDIAHNNPASRRNPKMVRIPIESALLKQTG